MFLFKSLSLVWPTATPWTIAHQASLSCTISRSLLKVMSVESMISSNYLVLCHPLLLMPSIFSSIRVFFNELALCIRWPQYWSLSFSISPSNNIQGWFPLGFTGLISLLSKGLSRVFSTTVWKHQFFSAQPSLWSSSHICTWLLGNSIIYLYTYILSLLDFLLIQYFAKKRIRDYLKELSGLKPQSLG